MVATNAQTLVDLLFPVQGSTFPRDHGYLLYGAVSRVVPWVHEEDARLGGLGIFPLRGRTVGKDVQQLQPFANLRLRVAADHLPKLLPLAGKALALDSHSIRLGVPQVQALEPASAVSSAFVLIKLAKPGAKDAERFVTPGTFLEAARRQLAEINVRGEASIPLRASGLRAGEPYRRVLEIKGRKAVGYALLVEGLTAEESILLQQSGLGGRRLMGCGLFLPARARAQ